jgi:putative transposase
MAGDRYLIQDQQGTYFLTFTVINWIDVFSRREYRDILVNSLNYCIKEKGLRVNGWVPIAIGMTNHIHLVARCVGENKLSEVIRDFKKFTSKKIVEEIVKINESRREWMLDKFSFEAKRTGRAKNYKLWKDDNHAVEIAGRVNVWEKINYIHENPVRAAWVTEIDDYIYSSARDYAGKTGLVEIEKL